MDCKKTFLILFSSLLVVGCTFKEQTVRERALSKAETASVLGKADELAIWNHPTDPQRSVVIGNDKSVTGALYVYDLQGNLIDRSPYMNRPSGVSVRYGVKLSNGETVDVVGCAVISDSSIRIFKINPETRKLTDITTPEGISTGFERDVYGFCFYKRPSDGQLFAFVSRKKKDNIHQLSLSDDGKGKIKGTFVRRFGMKDQKSYVEGMVADDESGYFYCSDERYAILKYYADPNMQKEPFIRAFGLHDKIRGDREGLALYKKKGGKGYLIVSSQGDSSFRIYQREGANKYVKSAALHGVTQTDGIAASSLSIPPDYPTGIFAAHNDSENNYVFFDWYEFSRLK